MQNLSLLLTCLVACLAPLGGTAQAQSTDLLNAENRQGYQTLQGSSSELKNDVRRLINAGPADAAAPTPDGDSAQLDEQNSSPASKPSSDSEGSTEQQNPREPFTFRGVKNIVIMLDCSRSMRDSLPSKKTRMELATTTINEILKILPGSTKCALRVFGHQLPPGSECRATELLVPFGGNWKREITAKLKTLRPTGMTPLTYAIAQAVENDLKKVAGPTVVILFADGQDSCGTDPTAYVESLPTRGITNVKFVVCALQSPKDKTSYAQLRSIARTSNGRFYRQDQFDFLLSHLLEIKSTE